MDHKVNRAGIMRPVKYAAYAAKPLCDVHGLHHRDGSTCSPKGGRGACDGLLSFVATPEWRAAWWEELELCQPQVARRLIEKFPDRYPVCGAERKDN